MELIELVTAIGNGTYDTNLSTLTAAIKRRQESLSYVRFLTLEVGDRVRFNSSTKPAYLQGINATVVKKNREKVVVALDITVGRFRGNITTPVTLLEKI